MTSDEKFNINGLAIEYGKHYGIERLQEESDYDYRSRVAGELRGKKHLIEAHEAFSGRRYDDPDQGVNGPMTGLMGAIVKAQQGVEYSPNDPERQIGDDLAAGIIVRFKDDTAENLKAIFNMFGPEAGMDILETFSEKK